MAQISKGDTFTDGQQVTGARLNQLVDSSVLLAGAITDQPNITANTVASGDSVLLYDLSATALREANVSDVLGSNVPVVTSSITGGANSDITITPNDGTIVSGLAYTSGDGLTVTVTSTAHTLAVGQVILIAGAGTGYNGTFQVATVATNSFTYVMTTAATAGSGTLNYTKKGLFKNAGNESIAGSLFVAGNAVISGTTAIAGATTISGATTLTGGISGANTNVTGTLTASTVPTSGGHLTNKTYVDGTSSILANGWTKLPNGLIIQWGTHLTAMANYSVATITFPTAFPTACFTVQLTARAVTAKSSGVSGLENGIKLNGAPTTTNFSVYVNWAGSGAGDTIYPTWIAIGY